MGDVFAYFFMIGCGLAMGLTIGAIPAILIYRRGLNGVIKTNKTRNYPGTR